MLLKFSVENYLSFNKKVELNMTAGKVRKHPGHVIKKTDKVPYNILKSAVIYGANGSGKSNLINAFHKAKEIILSGDKLEEEIDVPKFKLDKTAANKPSSFEFIFVIYEMIFRYGYSIQNGIVKNEYLGIEENGKEKTIYLRSDDSFKLDYFEDGSQEHLFMEMLGKATRPNQLYLSKLRRSEKPAEYKNLKVINSAINWFKKFSIVIFPSTTFDYSGMIRSKDKSLFKILSQIVKNYDTGIENLELEEIDINQLDGLENWSDAKAQIEKHGAADSIQVQNRENKIIILKEKSEQFKAYKLITEHKLKNNRKVKFSLNEESDGTRRVLELIPAFRALHNDYMVVFIDEIGKSLHPNLVYTLVKEFFEFTRNSKSQLIFTTHIDKILSLDLFRKDEIWFIEKNSKGESELFSLDDFEDVRFDKRIRKSYLEGRFGAVPNLKLVP